MSLGRLRSAFISAALVAVSATPVLAQSSFAPPPLVPYGLSIDVDNAKTAAAAAVAEAKKNNWRMAVAVVDTGGYLVYFEKMADTQTGSVDLAIEKARTSALFRRPSKLFQDAVAGGGEGIRLLRLTGAIPIDGGVPIIVDGKLIGAVGISGGSGDQDGTVAKAGASALK
ncbi:GlcG/HbpS family heme-binding protein [Skermanella stibiiresistens]|uniref:GlcG/HbpS family heme-binding protein n=1 Tax=Skermanella stibiiresistens TaxID=913326 RepID=UPI00056B47A6|nr:heme-binding protein [Skermanella stibiiresistens]